LADYRYDALGRRIEFIDHIRGITTRYYHDGQSIVAEYTYSQGNPESPAREYVNGPQYIDERAVLRDVSDPENTEEHYYLLKDLYTVTGLAGSNGVLEEAYVYDTYGQAVIHAWPVGDVNRDGLVEADGGANNADLDAILAYVSQGDEPRVDLNISGAVDVSDLVLAQGNDAATPTTLTCSGLGNPFLFTGRLTDTLGADALEAASDPDGFRRVQDNRNRTYDPAHGRWLQRDPGAKGAACDVTHAFPRGGTTDPARIQGFAQRVSVEYVPETRDVTHLIRNQRLSLSQRELQDRAIAAEVEPTRLHGQYRDGMNLYCYVRENPMRYMDPQGTDIYLKTGNNTSNPINNAIHQNVCVDTWDSKCCGKTGIACFSFGYNGNWKWRWFSRTWLGWSSITLAGYLMEGEIYETDDTGTVVKTKKTTCTQDTRWLNYMRFTRVRTTDVYSAARHNCRKYAQWEYRDAP